MPILSYFFRPYLPAYLLLKNKTLYLFIVKIVPEVYLKNSMYAYDIIYVDSEIAK